jgi:cellulose synthase/poly-beta-1,6-N-acetylglucosamine synthase-like glycosyltransferase
VINDRSTDGTGAILARMTAENRALQLVTIDELPPGWLGKNHALYQGYLLSQEDWILFTDADIKFAPLTLQKALSYAAQKDLDHLAVLPQINSRSALFRSVMATFGVMLELKLRPWDVSKRSSKASVGVGAFNLVKRSAYEKAGTHTVISLRPDDDLKLGERIKSAGLNQGVLYGDAEIWLEWYTGLGQFVQGLMKNTFSVANYNFFLALAMAMATFFIVVVPVPLLLVLGYPFWLGGVLVMALQVVVMLTKRGIGGQWWYALMIPFAGLVMTYIIVKSALMTIRQGGIYWRDSFYPLSELKKQR